MEYQTQTAQIGTIAVEQNKVLRNTYMMLALTMIPTDHRRVHRHLDQFLVHGRTSHHRLRC